MAKNRFQQAKRLKITITISMSYRPSAFFFIPKENQRSKLNFFETFPECFLPSTVSKNTIKMIGHHSLSRDVMGQSYPICACTRANHARYLSVHVTFRGSSKHSLLK